MVEASKPVTATNGYKLYVIDFDSIYENSVYITEIWETKADHDRSLKVKGVKERLMKAMTLLDGHPAKGQGIALIGGTGM